MNNHQSHSSNNGGNSNSSSYGGSPSSNNHNNNNDRSKGQQEYGNYACLLYDCPPFPPIECLLSFVSVTFVIRVVFVFSFSAVHGSYSIAQEPRAPKHRRGCRPLFSILAVVQLLSRHSAGPVRGGQAAAATATITNTITTATIKGNLPCHEPAAVVPNQLLDVDK